MRFHTYTPLYYTDAKQSTVVIYRFVCIVWYLPTIRPLLLAQKQTLHRYVLEIS